jgi:hypothetical protein
MASIRSPRIMIACRAAHLTVLALATPFANWNRANEAQLLPLHRNVRRQHRWQRAANAAPER